MTTIIHNDHFFKDQDVTNAEFTSTPSVELGFRSIGLVLSLLGKGDVAYSFNGKRTDGMLDCHTRSITLDNKGCSRIWFKVVGTPAQSAVRISAWPRTQSY